MEKLREKRKKAWAFIRASWRVSKIDEKFKVADFKPFLKKAFADKTAGIRPHKTLIRLAGQSGSGKTTQLLPAARAAFEKNKVVPVHVAVREFAGYHPYAEEIRTAFGAADFRENTNNFAMTLAFLTVEKLIENGYPVLFEVTLLDEDFEDYLAGLAWEKGYGISYHVLAVPRKNSDDWIEERKKGSKTEKARNVLSASKDYFYESLPRALAALKKSAPEAACTVWSGDAKDPVFIGKMGDGKVLETVETYREKEVKPHDPGELAAAKKSWFIRRQAI